MRPILISFWHTFYGGTDAGLNLFLGQFQTVISNDIKALDDIDYNCFREHVASIQSVSNQYMKLYARNVVRFYNWINTEHHVDVFAGTPFPSYLLNQNNMSLQLMNGYVLVAYNPAEPVPAEDKWVFYYGGMSKANSDEQNGAITSIDFTRIRNTSYREWTKQYIWNDSASMYSKHGNFKTAVKFWNYLSDVKEGKILTLYASKTASIIPTTNEIVAYKNKILSDYPNDITRAGKIYGPRAVLTYLKSSELVSLEEGIFYYLTYTRGGDIANNDVISKEDLKKITEAAATLSENSVLDALCHLILYIGLETEFRISQILNLDVDCVKETGMTNKYTVYSKTKTSAGEFKEQPITIFTKRHIDGVIRLTHSLRGECGNEELRQKLFLVSRRRRKNQYMVVQASQFNEFLARCCDIAGTSMYSFRNIRNTHMTLAEEKVIREGLSDMQQNVLSGHTNIETDNRYYVNTSIRNLLESIHGIIIGNVNVAGEILTNTNEEVEQDANLVSGKCGYCKAKACDNTGYLDCMMCSHFATTLSRLPYFEEQVKLLDERIKQSSVLHDKEDLVNVKRLCLSYMEQILIKQEEQYAN